MAPLAQTSPMLTPRTPLLFLFFSGACGGGEFIANHAPMAFAGFDQVAPSGSQVYLDGRLSSDPDGNALSFRWSLLEPTDGSVTLLESDQPSALLKGSPTFAGRALVSLVVSDGVAISAPDWVTARFSATVESLPVADAGANFLHPDTGEDLQLQSGQADFLGEQQWMHIRSPDDQLATFPAGPGAQLQNPAEGGHLFALVLSDERGSSLPDFLAVAVGPAYGASDLPQISGPAQIQAGEVAILQATHSSNGSWSVISAPATPPDLDDAEDLGDNSTRIQLTFQIQGRYIIGVTTASGIADWHALEVL